MDKYEFKLRSEEIVKLMEMQDYKSAVRLADTIDWRRVKSVATLVRIAELYKLNKRFDESRNLLEMAYDRNPGSKNVIYGLCEISLEFGDIVAAIEYFKEYVKVAPNDSGVYILRYHIYEAQNVGFEDRIELLEELKKKDRMEEWEYQLAYLYHRAGYATKCVEECDEIILWFGEGPYVTKAMELKMLHEPLTPSQQNKYDRRNETKIEEAARASLAKSSENIDDDDDFRVKTIDMSKFNTMNLQAELAENLKEFIEEEPTPIAQNYSSGVVDIRGDKEVFHNTIPADANEIFFADKTEDMRYAIPMPEQQNFYVAQPTSVSSNTTGSGMDMQEVRFEEDNKQNVSIDAHLSQQSDGQISLVNIEEKPVEKQITGQMNIADILEGWERMKLENTQKFREEVRQKLLEQTGEIFAEFELNSKAGMLSTLDNPDKIDDVMGKVSHTVMKGIEQDVVTPIEEAVPMDTITTSTVVGVLGETENPVYEQIIPNQSDTEEVLEEKDVITDNIEEVDLPEQNAQENEDELSETVEEDVEEIIEEAEEEMTLKTEESDGEVFEEIVPETIEEEIAETEEMQTTVEEVLEEPAVFYGAVTENIPGGIWKEVDNSIAADEQSGIEEETVQEDDNPSEKPSSADLSQEEKEQFSAFLYSKKMKQQIIKTLDGITLAAYSGNVLISSETDESALALAKQIVRHVQSADSNFSGKVAKISAESMNKKSVPETMQKLVNGALLIEHASNMNKETIKNLLQGLNQEEAGILVILMDRKNGIQKLEDRIPYVKEFFNCRVDIIPMSMEMLISFAVRYARDLGYVIDDMGHLALSKCISDMRRGNHTVTIDEIKEVVNDAIAHSKKKKLFGKARKDDEGYIILKEKDFE